MVSLPMEDRADREALETALTRRLWNYGAYEACTITQTAAARGRKLDTKPNKNRLTRYLYHTTAAWAGVNLHERTAVGFLSMLLRAARGRLSLKSVKK